MITDIATGQAEDREATREEEGENPTAVALGRLGGLRGGKARTASYLPSRGKRCRGRPLRSGGRLKSLIDTDWLRTLLDLNDGLQVLFHKGNSFVVFDDLEGWRIHQRVHVAMVNG